MEKMNKINPDLQDFTFEDSQVPGFGRSREDARGDPRLIKDEFQRSLMLRLNYRKDFMKENEFDPITATFIAGHQGAAAVLGDAFNATAPPGVPFAATVAFGIVSGDILCDLESSFLLVPSDFVGLSAWD